MFCHPGVIRVRMTTPPTHTQLEEVSPTVRISVVALTLMDISKDGPTLGKPRGANLAQLGL